MAEQKPVPKRFDIYAVIYAVPAAILYDLSAALSLGVGLAAVGTVFLLPVYLLWLVVNFFLICGFTVWFFFKWKSIVHEDGFDFRLLFGGVLIWIVWLGGSIVSIFLPLLTATILVSAWLTNHYNGLGRLVDWTINIVTVGTGYFVKAGAKVAVQKGVQIAARRATERTAEKAALKGGTQAAARLGAGVRGGTVAEKAVAGTAMAEGEAGAVALEELEAQQTVEAGKGGAAAGERMPWEEKTQFEKMQEYFEEVPQPQSEDSEEEDGVVLEDHENKVDLSKL